MEPSGDAGTGRLYSSKPAGAAGPAEETRAAAHLPPSFPVRMRL
jgi:hypothetical protein